MKALLLSGTGFEQFAYADCATPRPRAGEVLLRMRAAAVGLRDYKVVNGAYAAAEQTRPLVPGSEGVGEIVELGAGVDGLRLGQRVNPLVVQGWLAGKPHPATVARNTLGGPLLHGCFGEFLAVRADSVVEVPAHLSDVEAATLPFAGLTAWCAIVDQGRIGAGDVVLVQGTGGIPLYALQFAKARGATVIVSSKSDDKLERARTLGADHVINYQSVPEWSAAVLELTQGLGADLVLDPGGSMTLAQSIRAVRPGGTISIFNALGSADIDLNLPYLLSHNIAVYGVNAGPCDAHMAMAAAIGASGLCPVIESVTPIAEGAAAVARAPKSEQFGKACLQF
jgi:NADPH:quinone reductase-like Zn-dependent oxidoreductase